MKIGFIGQGWIGKNYADNFEDRGFDIVRYSVEPEYVGNREKIKECDIVFIAVPTPTTPDGFDYGIVQDVISLVGDGKVALIKSTIAPGTTEKLQEVYPNKYVIHSPEFLEEARARENADHPDRNIIGIPVDNDEYKSKAEEVMSVLPEAPYKLVCSSRDAELIKYSGNVFLYFKILFANLLFDLSAEVGADYEKVKEATGADPRIGPSHLSPVHKSGRGAGGHCFIKDFAAYRGFYEQYLGDDKKGLEVLKALEEKNIELLLDSKKDLDLLEGVYGSDVAKSVIS